MNAFEMPAAAIPHITQPIKARTNLSIGVSSDFPLFSLAQDIAELRGTGLNKTGTSFRDLGQRIGSFRSPFRFWLLEPDAWLVATFLDERDASGAVSGINVVWNA
jgi:hypothetical protein